jgi:CheY-like chemotaxis protein
VVVTARQILIVDDEADIRTVASVALGKVGGHDVLTCDSGAGALEVARAQQPDAIVLDVMMPGMDGPATLAALHDDEATADIPVVFLTAKAQSADRAGLTALGAHGIITKPFDPLSLADELAAVLGWE